MWAGLKKAFQPPTHMALLKKKNTEYQIENKKKSAFFDELRVSCTDKKKKGKVFIAWYFLWLFCMHQFFASYNSVDTQFFKIFH